MHGRNLHHFSAALAEALLDLRDALGLLHTYHSIWREPESVALDEACGRFDAHFTVSEFLSAAVRRYWAWTARNACIWASARSPICRYPICMREESP